MKRLKLIIFTIVNNTIKVSKNKNSVKFLGCFSFLESIVIPIPVDIILIPLVLAKRNQWLFLGLFCTFFSIGRNIRIFYRILFWDNLGNYIIEFYNAENEITLLKEQFSKYGIFIILIAGFTPLPYKVFTIGSGLLSFNIYVFLLCSFFSRGLRFVSLSYLVYKYGERSLKFAEKYFNKLTLILVVILIIIFIVFYV